MCLCLCVCLCVCSWEAGGKEYRWEGMQGGGVERGGGERTACMKLQTKDGSGDHSGDAQRSSMQRQNT